MTEDTKIGRTPEDQIVAETPAETPDVTAGLFWSSAAWLGDPGSRYDKLVSSRYVPMNVKLEMLCDPVVAFTMGYITTVLTRAKYRIECADEKKRRFFEAMYGATHREFMLQAAPAIALGCLGLIKKFEFAVPPLLKIDDPPIWDSDVTPYILTGFDQIYPIGSRPVFKGGRFAGIDRARGDRIDVFYSLWLTRGKEEAFGNYAGRGRLNTCYRNWWLKEFGLDLYVVFLQKNIDRVVKVEHPSGGIENVDGTVVKPFKEIAKETGDAVRSGATVTMPSTVYEMIDIAGQERLSAVKKWAIEFLEGTQNVAGFHEMEDQRDVRISLGMLIPPQAYLNVKQSALGGPTTADVLSVIAERLLLIDTVGIDLHLNEYVFPIVDRANFPPGSPPVKKVTYALADADLMTLKELVMTLVSRIDVDVSQFDLGEALTRLGMPLAEEGITHLLSPEERKVVEAALAQRRKDDEILALLMAVRRASDGKS